MVRCLLFVLLVMVSFWLSGCVYSDEPIPEIITESGPYIIRPLPGESVEITPPAPIPQLPTEGGIPSGWIPEREDARRWKGIVIHHSDSFYGSAAQMDKYHKSIGWDGLGYHFVIDNGVYNNGYGKPDGLVEVGYRWRNQIEGAHCRVNGRDNNYWNEHTIGICLVGDFNKSYPTEKQWQSALKLVRFLQKRYSIPTNKIVGHRDVKPTDCPGRNFSMTRFKAGLGY
ncbi:MAG: peptidoglycan recognition family protein [Planctomycetota bacterium]